MHKKHVDRDHGGGGKYHRTTIKQTAEGVLGISTHLLVYFLSLERRK
jgi:hypothetical protein